MYRRSGREIHRHTDEMEVALQHLLASEYRQEKAPETVHLTGPRLSYTIFYDNETPRFSIRSVMARVIEVAVMVTFSTSLHIWCDKSNVPIY